MIPIFHTRDQAKTAIELGDHYKKVVIRSSYVLNNPVRLIRKRIMDLAPFLCLKPVTRYAKELARWQVKGGTLFYEAPYPLHMKRLECSVQLVCECPVSIERLENVIRGTQKFAVVYKPITWDEHWHHLKVKYPDGELAQRFVEILRAADTDRYAGKMVGYEGDVASMVDIDFAEKLGIPIESFWKLRNALLRAKGAEYPKRVLRVYLRVPPQDDPELTKIYRYVEENFPEDVEGARVLAGSELYRNVPKWRINLRKLEHLGCLKRDMPMYFYFGVSTMKPDVQALDRSRQVAVESMKRIINLVESTDEFSLLAMRSSQLSFRGDRSRPTSAG